MLPRCLVSSSVLNFVPISFPTTPGRSKKCYVVNRDWSKRIARGGRVEGRRESLSPWEGVGCSQFSCPWSGSSCFITLRNWYALDTIRQQRLLIPVPKGGKRFESWLKKYTWLVYNKDGNFNCKICTKAKKSHGMSRGALGRNFQNTALFRHAGLQRHQMANFCLHAICPQEYGTHVH